MVRRTLHALIRHFLRNCTDVAADRSGLGRTTKQATPFLKSCTDIIPIGRVQWIPGSKYKGGKDNAAWYHFDARHTAGPDLSCVALSARTVAVQPCARSAACPIAPSLGLQVLLERLPPARLSRARKRNASVTRCVKRHLGAGAIMGAWVSCRAAAWLKARRQALHVAQWRCQRCGASVTGSRQSQVHHRKPRDGAPGFAARAA